jgi:hypothetical protein
VRRLVEGGGSVAGVQQCGGRGIAGPIWARSGPGGLVCLCCGVRSAIRVGAGGTGLRHDGGGGSSLPCGSGASALASGRSLLLFSRPRGGVCSGAAWMCPRPWWHVLAGGKMVGWLRFERVTVLGGEGEVPAGSSGSDAVTPEGAAIHS